MALTVLEELQILNGTVGPDVILVDLVHQIAMGTGVEFHINYKVFPIKDGEGEPINSEAQLYLNKILGVINRVYSIDNQTVNSLTKLEVSLIGDSSVSWVDITGDPGPPVVPPATDAQWETFIASNMLRTFELLGRVLKEEKTAYDALPQSPE